MASYKQLLSLAILSGASLALNAQTNDWHAVESMALGTSISVGVVEHRGWRDCDLVNVTGSELTCERERGFGTRTLVLRREEVREVRLEQPGHNRMIAGAVVGLVVGAMIGGLAAAQSGDPEVRVSAPELGAFLGACLGGGIGHDIHRHGPVVYRK